VGVKTWLYVAAGGGGDALAAAMLHEARAPGQRAVVATYAWDRLLIDPLPGPRPAADFTGLEPVGAGLWQVTAHTAPIPPAGSSLPRMAADLDAQILLLDPYRGALGMAAALAEAVRVFDPDGVTLVDVGGDVLARGDEPELKSPLADHLALAACLGLDAEVDVAVLGLGLDGELPVAYALARIEAAGGRPGPRLESRHVEAIAPLLAWHPSEASGMLAAAACGVRGTVEVRDAGSHIVLDEASPDSWLIPAGALAATGLLPDSLAGTADLGQVEAAVRAVCGGCELDYERRKAASLREAPAAPADPGRLAERYQRFMLDGAARGSDFVTIRRMAEMIGAPRGAGFEPWRTALIADEPHRYARPLWSLRPA
jgi:hypothetical protein